MLAAFGVYSYIVVPIVEPTLANRNGPPVNSPTPNPRKNPFAHLFEDGDWELESPKIIETAQGTLIFLDYRPLDDGRLEIRPCTLIVFSAETEDRQKIEQSARPVVMRASEGAILQFDEEVDLARGKLGRLIGGRVLGDVRIFTAESAPNAGDGFEFVTRNLQIERTKVYTTGDIKFRYGSSHGSGRDLTLNLSPAEAIADGGAKRTAIGKLESVQLTHVEEIYLQSAQHSILPDASPAKVTRQQPPVKITCDGPLRYSVERRMATFDQNVNVLRLVENSKPDRLNCKQLAVFLAKSGDKKTTPAKPAASPLASGNAVERIVAVGEPVVLDSPSQKAHTTAARFEYNLQTKQLLLQSMNSGANILLKRGADEFTAPELHYEMVEGHQLGKLWAPGPGKMTTQLTSATGPRLFSANWKKEIRIRPQDGNQLISLTEQAQVDVENQGSFKADEIHFWLIEVPPSPDAKASSPDAKVSPPDTKPSTTNPIASRVLPDRILATGKVQADSPQLSADVDRLEAWFQHVPAEIPQSPVKQLEPQPSSDLILQPAAGPAPQLEPELHRPIVRIQEPLGSPVVNQPANPQVERVEVVPQHFHVTGQLVQMQIAQQGKTSTIQELSVQGERVRVLETNPKEGEEPFWLSGQRIDLEGGTGPTAFITVGGAPAMVSARGFCIQSKTLKLSRRDNRLLVEQAGEMFIPIQQDFSGESLKDTRELKISWDGSLVFDGSLAKFRRGIHVRGPDFWAKSDEMQTTLTSRIDFGRTSPGGAKPEVKKLSLFGHVDLEHRGYTEEGRQQSVERMTLATLEIDRVSGAINGLGPGVVRNVRLGGGPPIGLPSAPMETKTDDSLTFLRVDFQKALSGNMLQHKIAFNDKVRAIHGPVANWEAQIEPQRKEELGQRGVILDTDQLSVNEFVTRGLKQGPIELLAEGNTRVEGRDFTAIANRLTYATVKNQLVLEGDGRKDAQVTDHVRNGSTEARRILVWTDTNTIQVDDARSLTIGPVGSAPGPRPPGARDMPRR